MITQSYSEFQRYCLKQYASYLPNTKILVKALGSDALETYCRRRYLPAEYIDRVKETERQFPFEAPTLEEYDVSEDEQMG